MPDKFDDPSKDRPNNGLPGPEKQTDKPKDDDPLDFKNRASSVGVLILVCFFLYIVFSLGPKGADWMSEQVSAAFGDAPAETDKESEDEGGNEIAESGDKSKTDNEEPPKAAEKPAKETVDNEPTKKESQVVETTNSKNEKARAQLLEALGGSKKAEIRHLAFSKKSDLMVASIRLLEDNSVEEIIFELDEFERYVPKEGSKFGSEIKIWIQE